jgi:hypothetical protein
MASLASTAPPAPTAPPASPAPPDHITYETTNAHRLLCGGGIIPCSHCGKKCTNLVHALPNENPPYKNGSGVEYCIVFCSHRCQTDFIENCTESAPFQTGSVVVFYFYDQADDTKFGGYWRMFSIIPENGDWFIFKCDVDGKALLSPEGDMEMELVPHAFFQQAGRVYI